jgi:arylformamidase
MKRLWDISPPVGPGAPVFPGDTPYSQYWAATMGPGSPVNVATVTLSPHVGAHADAPLHYDPAGAAPAALALAPYLGPCRVIHAIACGPLVRLADIAHALSDLPPRVLLRTFERAPVQNWVDDFSAIAPEALEHLAGLGLQLIGIDTASIDPADSKTLPCHQLLRRFDLRVLENLVLDEVPEGDYELIALPLAWTQACASPVRAVLRAL